MATNLSGAFANQNKTVTLCDLDRQQSSLRWMAFRDPALPQVTGYFGGGQIVLNLPKESDWVVLDAPAGLQGYKLSDYLRVVDKVIVPLVPSVFDMAATEDFLNSIRNEMRGRRQSIGIVAMRVDPRTKAAGMRIGLVEQDSGSGRYDLGAYALELGLSGLGRLDPVRLAVPFLEELCETVQETVALAVWGTHGATIVRIADAGGPVTVTLRAGTVLPLYNSATGRAFAAFHRSPYLKKFLDKELDEASGTSKVAITTLRRQLEKNLTEIREKGISRATGSLTPGINGFSAPVYDHSGQMVAAITSLGPVGEFNVEWDSPVASAMLKASQGLSQRLGFLSQEKQ